MSVVGYPKVTPTDSPRDPDLDWSTTLELAMTALTTLALVGHLMTRVDGHVMLHGHQNKAVINDFEISTKLTGSGSCGALRMWS